METNALSQYLLRSREISTRHRQTQSITMKMCGVVVTTPLMATSVYFPIPSVESAGKKLQIMRKTISKGFVFVCVCVCGCEPFLPLPNQIHVYICFIPHQRQMMM
jgi:hypothetical protein